MFWALVTMCLVLMLVCFLGRYDHRAAHKVLQFGQSALFEPEGELLSRRGETNKLNQTKRGYVSPLVRNQIAKSQHWRCNICGKELDASFDLDHIVPLSRGGSNDRNNLQAICHSPCHVSKSAAETSSRARGARS